MIALCATLSPSVEARSKTRSSMRAIGVQRSRRMVVKLAGLFSLDAFAGGLIVQSIVAYWFFLRYDADLTSPAMARRFGLLNTMVFTHLPSNLLLLLVPVMPDLKWAVTALLARNLLSQLDVPTRQSYTMAIVHPDERAASAGVLSVARNVGASVAPFLPHRF